MSVLPWVAPPMVRTIIGYVTDRVTIRTLFRSHTAVCILSIRLTQRTLRRRLGRHVRWSASRRGDHGDGSVRPRHDVPVS